MVNAEWLYMQLLTPRVVSTADNIEMKVWMMTFHVSLFIFMVFD